MTLRSLVLNRLKANAELMVLIPAARWQTSTAVDETPPRPFAVVRYAGIFPGIGRVRQTRLEVWIHEEPGSYTTINRALLIVEQVMDIPQPVKDPGSDTWLTEAVWEGSSVDLYDDAQRTNTRSATFNLIGTGF